MAFRTGLNTTMGNMVRELLAPTKRAMKSDPFLAVSTPALNLYLSECHGACHGTMAASGSLSGSASGSASDVVMPTSYAVLAAIIQLLLFCAVCMRLDMLLTSVVA